MRRTLSMLSLLALMTATAAYATPALDAAGKCRDNGKFVSAKHCQAPAATGKCRDVKTKKFAKCSAANTEPVPEKK
jgi:hypothetical protein